MVPLSHAEETSKKQSNRCQLRHEVYVSNNKLFTGVGTEEGVVGVRGGG